MSGTAVSGGRPLISVVITAYNAESYIRRALDSAFAQTWSPLEVVVINDGSTDRTAEIVASEYPEARLISQENKGISGARNAGLAAARGEWIAYLDSDDYWAPEKTERQLDFAGRHPGVRAFACNNMLVRGDRVLGRSFEAQRILGRAAPAGVVDRYFTGRARYAFHNSSVLLIHRSLFTQYGEFHPAYNGNEDAEFIMRLALHGEPIGYLDEPLCYYEVGNPESVTKKHVRHTRQLIHYWMSAEDRYPNARPEVLPDFRRTRHLTFFNSGIKVLLRTGNNAEARELLRLYRARLIGPRWLAWYALSFLPTGLLRRAKHFLRRISAGTIRSTAQV
ncbi:MAG: glycosyltransferase family 2 protein [Acetobacterales bacterium]